MDNELATESDHASLRNLAGDDLAMFDQLVRTWTPRLSALAHRLLAWSADEHEVEDVVQEVFLAAWDHLSEFRGEASVGTWLTRITINQCRQRHRRRQVWLNWLRRVREQTGTSPPGSVACAIELDENIVQLRAAVASLPHKYREIIVLHHLEQRDLDAIGQLLGVRKNTVEVRLHRARRLLKTRLNNDEQNGELER